MIDNRHLILAAFIIVVLGGLIIAKPDFGLFEEKNKTVVEVGPSQGHATVKIPSHAVEVMPGVFFLGTEIKGGKLLEGYAIVDYKRNYAKPTGCNYDGRCQGWEDASCDDCAGAVPEESTCYTFLSKGAKWRTVEPYLINTANTRGLSGQFISSNFASDIDKWEDAVGGVEILGDATLTSSPLSADMYHSDGNNEVYFADIADSGAIAMTVFWGKFSGPPSSRELDEWDMIFDDVDYDWGDNESGKMDFENIATHELGHAIGLGDLYDTKCSDQTMYGYADYRETDKRTLESGDITGAQLLYG